MSYYQFVYDSVCWIYDEYTVCFDFDVTMISRLLSQFPLIIHSHCEDYFIFGQFFFFLNLLGTITLHGFDSSPPPRGIIQST